MFRSLVGHLFKPSRFTLDNLAFRLHYRVTVGLLLVFCLAVLWKINFGNPIRCEGRDGHHAMNDDHCWYQGTFTNPEARDKLVGVDVPAPGIDKLGSLDTESHNMHRWVVVGLLVQAVFFYLPRILWRTLEGRRVHRLVWNMNDPRVPGDRKIIRKHHIGNYLRGSRNLGYVVGHAFCELLNLVNVVAQLLLVSHILQTPLISLDMLTKSRSERNDSSALDSFPLHTKCSFYKFGSSGDVRKHSLLCVMSINGVMESVFICQWIWFVLLTLLSIIALAYRAASLVLPKLRSLRLEAKTKLTGYSTVDNVTRRMGVGQWFLLYLLSKNVDPVHMRDVLESLAEGVVNKDETRALSML